MSVIKQNEILLPLITSENRDDKKDHKQWFTET